MTISFLSWAPEVFFISALLTFLWYGTGPAVRPVSEAWWMPHRGELSSVPAMAPNISLATAGPNHSVTHLTWWCATLCVLTALLLAYSPLSAVEAGGCFVRDSFTQQLGRGLMLYSAVCLVARAGWYRIRKVIHTEYLILVLLALLGQHLLLMCTNLMALYLCLELQSFSLVVLCSLNYSNAYSVEAGMKYFLLSAFRSSLLLLGVGLIYWQTGLVDCGHLQELLLCTAGEASLTTWMGIWLVSLALLWKLARAPLHLWAADVYQGSWSSVTLLMSTLPKISVLGFWAHHWHNVWYQTFGTGLRWFRAASLIVGAVAPLAQVQIKRLLAFSSVGHMGFMLMPLAAGSEGFSALWVYLIIYLITSLVTWGLLFWPFGRPSSAGVAPQYIWDLAGLKNSNPAAAAAWGIAVLSLAGLPPVGGFLGKLGVFWSSLTVHQYALLSVALRATLLGSVYYLRVLKLAYVDQPTAWSSLGRFAPVTAYLVSSACLVLLLVLWHGAPLVLFSHLLALVCSDVFEVFLHHL